MAIKLEHGFLFLLLLLFHLLIHLFLDVINDLQFRVLTNDECLRRLDFSRHLDLRQESLLHIGLDLLHQSIELIGGSVRLFLLILSGIE